MRRIIVIHTGSPLLASEQAFVLAQREIFDTANHHYPETTPGRMPSTLHAFWGRRLRRAFRMCISHRPSQALGRRYRGSPSIWLGESAEIGSRTKLEHAELIRWSGFGN